MAGWSRPHRRHRFSGFRSSRVLKRIQEATLGPAGPFSHHNRGGALPYRPWLGTTIPLGEPREIGTPPSRDTQLDPRLVENSPVIAVGTVADEVREHARHHLPALQSCTSRSCRHQSVSSLNSVHRPNTS